MTCLTCFSIGTARRFGAVHRSLSFAGSGIAQGTARTGALGVALGVALVPLTAEAGAVHVATTDPPRARVARTAATARTRPGHELADAAGTFPGQTTH